MDIKRDSSGQKKLRILYGVVAVLVVVGITFALSRLERAAPTVDSATLWRDTVQRGEPAVQTFYRCADAFLTELHRAPCHR